ALRRAASAAARGHLDLESADGHDAAWRRLRTIPAIGAWTCEKLAFHGQGRDDRLPAADLAYLKLVGHLAGLGRRASEEEVRTFFAPYDEHAALAGIYLLAGSQGVTALPPAGSARRLPGADRAGDRAQTRPSPEELVEKAAHQPVRTRVMSSVPRLMTVGNAPHGRTAALSDGSAASLQSLSREQIVGEGRPGRRLGAP
ncbi:MAG TPA: hypothetical protein VE270_06950, partial [Thermoleophilaceae bacterium]|nr:hypothetical protein [Thermoleophilaceae bacterium]